MASGTIRTRITPFTIDAYNLTGYASESGFKSVIDETLDKLSVGQILPVWSNVQVSITDFYTTYYSGFLSKLSADRGWGILCSAFGDMHKIVEKDGTVTISSM